MSSGEIFVELAAVGFSVADRVVIEEAALLLVEGQTTMVMGRAGSGKSLILKLAAGILQPSSGAVLCRGKSLATMTSRELARFHAGCGFVFQDAALWANMSLFDNIAFPYRLHRPGASGREVEKAVKAAAERAGYSRPLAPRPAEISGSERMLVGIARAIVLDPEFLALDEPTASLDETERGRVYDLVKALEAAGKTVIIAGASPRFAREVADHVVVVREGRLLPWRGEETVPAQREATEVR